MAELPDLVLPAGVTRPDTVAGHGLIVNQTELPDYEVETYIETHASVLGVSPGNSYGTYRDSGGSLLTRSKFRAPETILEEICLARDLAERDDDVGATMGALMATAFSEPFRHEHADETVIAIFDELANEGRIPHAFTEIYRELLIASQVTTATAFTLKGLQFQPSGADRQRTRTVQVPRLGVIPAEQIRVLGSDMFGTGTLAFAPATGAQERWLQEFFEPRTTSARKAEMRRQDPVLASLLLSQKAVSINDMSATAWGDDRDPPSGQYVYLLNPAMTERSTFAKGAARYARPLLTRNFALLEAKRLLNIMDYALLESGANFLVVVKKGTDQRPATNPEVANLREQVRRASRTGVMIGDHRLSVEIITPKLEELLNPGKRKLLGRKLSMALLRLPAFADERGATEEVKVDVELMQRVITLDRTIVRDHVMRAAYEPAAKRNGNITGPAGLWFPKILLAGTQWFTDLVLKLRDRGDIPREYAVEAAGYAYPAALATRKREKSNGDDRVLTPPPVPFTGQGGGPNDNGGGRPAGGSSANGAPGSKPQRSSLDPGGKPRQVVTRNPGETVRAYEESDGIHRAGELTYAILEQYIDTSSQGRLTKIEHKALARIEDGDYDTFAEGPLTIVPVNVDEDLDRAEVRAVRLAPGLSMIVASRFDGAILARALVFRQPEFRAIDAHEQALRWGFDVEPVREPRASRARLDGEVEDETAQAQSSQPIVIQVGGAQPMELVRDEHGAIVGSRPIPQEG